LEKKKWAIMRFLGRFLVLGDRINLSEQKRVTLSEWQGWWIF
jgi:hypothetical protein